MNMKFREWLKKTLYHATLQSNVNGIRSQGLLPGKSANWKDWSEKDYVYLALTPDIALQWIRDLWEEQIRDRGDIENFDNVVILSAEVDESRLVHDVGSNYKLKGIIQPHDINIYETYEAEMTSPTTFVFKRKR